MQVAGVGEKPLEWRRSIFLHYHCSAPEGHLKRDKTLSAIERDWWRSTVDTDVRKLCRLCESCQREAGASAMEMEQAFSYDSA